MTDSLFNIPDASDEDALLIAVYERTARTLDDLPYTQDFAAICAAIDMEADPRAVFHKLHNLRKAGKLPRMGRAPSSPITLDPDEENLVTNLVTARCGTLGQRDQLPYTPAFDDILQAFNAQTGRALDPHAFWRLVAKLAK